MINKTGVGIVLDIAAGSTLTILSLTMQYPTPCSCVSEVGGPIKRENKNNDNEDNNDDNDGNAIAPRSPNNSYVFNIFMYIYININIHKYQLQIMKYIS